jgi:antitoxin component YwqK of YwqJK toxin-antitoxin module
MARFIKPKTELFVSEEFTGDGYIVESDLYKLEEELGGVLNDDGTIPPNRSFINVKKGRIVRYYDINRIITKTIEYYVNPEQVSQICLFKNGKLNDDGDISAITTYHRDGRVYQKMRYTDNECTNVEVCNEPPAYQPPRNGDLVPHRYIKIELPSSIE